MARRRERHHTGHTGIQDAGVRGVLKNEVGKSEKIGVVGSPSSTSQMRLDIVASAVEKSLVGSIAFLEYTQDDSDTYAIGQITGVTLKNAFAEDQTMRSITKQRGEIPSITGQQDTYAAEMMISAVFKEEGGRLSQSTFGTVPPTGTAIRMINQSIMDKMVEPHADHVVHVGSVFGNDVLLPSWFRHFGETGDGGLGDAMHIGIFGKTGSGKSVLGKMIMLSYMKHETMSLLVLDPQGEFSKIDGDGRVRNFVDSLGRRIAVYDLSRLVLLPDEDLFKKILIDSKFILRLGVKALENQGYAADQIVRILRSRDQTIQGEVGAIELNSAYERAAFDRVWRRLREPEYMDHIYRSGTPAHRQVPNTMNSADVEEFYALWQGVTRLFGREGGDTYEIGRLLDNVGSRDGSVTVINLSETDAPAGIFWNEEVQKVVINQILSKLVAIAQGKFAKGGNLNTLVVLDEAHRFAPRTGTYGDDEGSALRRTLLDAVRTTRKFGLGWMFISQTLASLDRELVQQLRMYFFGYGLAWGTELDALQNLIGGNRPALSLYQQFHDPASSLEGGKYSFMSVGPSSPLAFSGMPLFFNSLQFPEEFLSKNGAGGNAA